jgi:hypothetical protein
MVLRPNGPAVKGREPLLGFFQTFRPFSDYRQETQEIEGLGNLVYDRETYSVPMMPPGCPLSEIQAGSSGSDGSRPTERGNCGAKGGTPTCPLRTTQG